MNKVSFRGALASAAVSAVILSAWALPAQAFENGFRAEVEAGAVWQSFNEVQSPATATPTLAQGTRFSFQKLQGAGPSPYARLSGGYTWDDRHQVHLLYAPLTITGTGSFASPVLLEGTAFAANRPTEGRYRFDSYRVGYRYKFFADEQWQIWGGATLKLRDADIGLTQGVPAAHRANTGVVPLLSLYIRRELSEDWSAILDIEGLAAPQGRAIDAAVKLRHQFSNGMGMSVGYRMLEGGADNKNVYTFAWLHYGLVAMDYRF